MKYVCWNALAELRSRKHTVSTACPICTQPVQGDWRKRFAPKAPSGSSSSATSKKATKAAAAAAAAQQAPAYPKTSKTKPDLEGLSQGLPSGWKATWDKANGDIYYENRATKVREEGGRVRRWLWSAAGGVIGGHCACFRQPFLYKNVWHSGTQGFTHWCAAIPVWCKPVLAWPTW